MSCSIYGVHASEIIVEIASDILKGLCSPIPTTSKVLSSIPTMHLPPFVLAKAIISFRSLSCLAGISRLNSIFLLSPK